MYRGYENPRGLEEQLGRLQKELNRNPKLLGDDEFHAEIDELRDRISAAWQDEYEDD